MKHFRAQERILDASLVYILQQRKTFLWIPYWKTLKMTFIGKSEVEMYLNTNYGNQYTLLWDLI